MKQNRILAVYPDICDHSCIMKAFADVICVSDIIEAVKTILVNDFYMILVDSKMVANGNESILITLKTVTTVPILVVNDVVHKNNFEHRERHLHQGYHHSQNIHPEVTRELRYHSILQFGELIIDPNRRKVCVEGTDLNLTKIEFDILYFLARHEGRVMSRDQIYANVWIHDSSFDIDELVKAHIKRLRKKFASLKYTYIYNVRGVGYKFCV